VKEVRKKEKRDEKQEGKKCDKKVEEGRKRMRRCKETG